MFSLVELKDTIRVTPDQFKVHMLRAVRDQLNKKLANKVLLNVGLCIALRNIVSISNSMLLPGDGASHSEVNFLFIVFRPAVGTLITGKIRSCSREGVHVTLGFFDDILIPANALQHPSRFDETEQAWIWEYPLENGERHDLYMDIGESIKFRVAREIFEEISPIGPPNTIDVNSKGVHIPKTENKSPYKIIAAINESGLGVISWWAQQNQGETDEPENSEASDNEENAIDDNEEGYEN